MQQNRSQKNNKISHLGVGMDTKNETVWYSIGTNEMIQYFNGTSLHYYLINCVVNRMKQCGTVLVPMKQYSTLKVLSMVLYFIITL